MAIVKVNRSGKNQTVYLTNACTPDEVIGTIYNNEMFTWVSEWPGSAATEYYVQAIYFRGSDGTPKYGWIGTKQTDKVLETNICNLAMFTKVINGTTYYGFKMRRDEELYDRNGKSIARIASKGRRILCQSSTAGQEHPGWLSVYYLESGENTDLYIELVPGSNAFVDLGYDKGSTFNSNTSLIGSLG